MTATITIPGIYSVESYPGVAFIVTGWVQQWEPERYLVVDEDEGDVWEETDPYEGEWIDSDDQVVAYMVGDDQPFEIDVVELSPLDEGDYCDGCGQVGCGAHG